METVLITGANRGIGFELTRQYLTRGAQVIATCRDPDTAHDLQDMGVHNDRLLIAPLDVRDQTSVDALAQTIDRKPLDIVINNAGVMGGDHQRLDDMDYDAWTETLETNTIAPFRVAAALVPNLKQTPRPRLITVSSQMGSLNRQSTGAYIYRSSKAAVNKVMQVMSLELRSDGIIVCPVHPGCVRTDMGGPSADISVEESVRGLTCLISRLTIEDSGKFFQWNGEEHAW